MGMSLEYSLSLDLSSVDETKIEELGFFFKMLGDTTRVRIMLALMGGELRVGDIALQLDMTTSAISHQLRLLRQAHIVISRRSGKEVFYKLDGDRVETILGLALRQIREGAI